MYNQEHMRGRSVQLRGTAFESELSSQLPFMELLSSGEFP